MPIIASLIARGNVVLCEYCPSGTNFPSISRRLLEQIPSTPDSKKSYSYESYNFHYLVENKITYICMTDQAMGYRIPYSFLFDLSSRFRTNFGDRINTANQGGMQDTFSRVIEERQLFFSNDKNADKINRVKGEIDTAKDVMVKNIDKVLDRGARIEVLVDKTEDLQDQSASFKQKGTKLKRKMWWKNFRLCCILICILVSILVGIIMIILWYTGALKNISGDVAGPLDSDSNQTGDSVINSGTELVKKAVAHALRLPN